MCIGGQTGEKLDMTNWFSVLLPLLLAPTLDGMRAPYIRDGVAGKPYEKSRP